MKNKLVREILAFSGLAVSLVGTILFSFTFVDRVLLAVSVLLVLAGLVVAEMFSRPLVSQAEKTRPIIRVWTHNGDMVVTSDKIFQFSREIEETIYPGLSFRTVPVVYALKVQSHWGSGFLSQEELDILLTSCSVQKTEMQIPSYGSGRFVGFKDMWRLIHGSDANPPELPQAS